MRSGIPIKTAPKKFPTSKSRKTSDNIATEQVYQAVLQSIISSLVQHCPREILIEISKYINTIYLKLKALCLNRVMENDTVKRRELVWKNATSKVQEVLFSLMQVVNTEQKPLLDVTSQIINNMEIEPLPDSNHSGGGHTLNHAIKAYAQRRSAERVSQELHQTDIKKSDTPSQLIPIYWPKPLDINFLQIKDADDVATISCKVGGVTIPYAMIDSGSDSLIISENVAKHLGFKIDRKKIHRLNGAASRSQSLGTINDIPITIEDGVDSLTTSDEFSVVPTEYDDNGKELSLFILGTQWQYRAGWEPLVKGEFKATRNGKTITIPLSVHKSQRNVFTVAKAQSQRNQAELKKKI